MCTRVSPELRQRSSGETLACHSGTVGGGKGKDEEKGRLMELLAGARWKIGGGEEGVGLQARGGREVEDD